MISLTVMKETQNISQEMRRINGQLYQTFIIKDDKAGFWGDLEIVRL